jgi:hypothetical protein
VAVGSELKVTVHSDRAGLDPILLVGTASVSPDANGAGSHTYRLDDFAARHSRETAG